MNRFWLVMLIIFVGSAGLFVGSVGKPVSDSAVAGTTQALASMPEGVSAGNETVFPEGGQSGPCAATEGEKRAFYRVGVAVWEQGIREQWVEDGLFVDVESSKERMSLEFHTFDLGMFAGCNFETGVVMLDLQTGQMKMFSWGSTLEKINGQLKDIE